MHGLALACMETSEVVAKMHDEVFLSVRVRLCGLQGNQKLCVNSASNGRYIIITCVKTTWV